MKAARSFLRISLISVVFLGGCASFDGAGLVPGQSAQEVEALMGPAAERRQKGTETWLYFPRQPNGKAMYVARIDGGGKLIALEQRLTLENVSRMTAGKSTREEMRELLGPPTTVNDYPRQGRQVWGYRMFADNTSRGAALYAQFSPDGVLREIFQVYEEDENPNMGAGGPGPS
jgi:hypothetical protein